MTSLADALFRPRAVALVGASGDAAKNTARPQRFLKKHGFTGRVVPINRTRDEVLGEPVFLQESLGPRGVLRRVARGTDQRDGARAEQGVGERGHDFGLGGRCENRRSKIDSAMRFFIISGEPPAIIQPRVRRKQYSTRLSWL